MHFPTMHKRTLSGIHGVRPDVRPHTWSFDNKLNIIQTKIKIFIIVLGKGEVLGCYGNICILKVNHEYVHVFSVIATIYTS